MKKLISLAALALIAFAPSFASAQAATPTAASPYDKAPWWMKTGVITQTGYVFAELPANRATFSATFLSVDDSEDKAQAMAIEKTRALQQALAKLGSDKVRVTTTFTMQALYQQYKDHDGNMVDNERGDKINGYEVSVEIALEVRDMDQLSNAYSLVMAAGPTHSRAINFRLQPDNATNTWLYTEAVKDARTRAMQAADAAGGKLGVIQLIDPTGRACQTDILAHGAPADDDAEDYMDSTEVVVTGMRSRTPPPPVVQPRITASDIGQLPDLEARALANTFIQTPPLQKLTATACVVYGLN